MYPRFDGKGRKWSSGGWVANGGTRGKAPLEGLRIGNESVPIQLTQCWFPEVTIDRGDRNDRSFN